MTGPQGSTGAQGSQGSQGPQGSAGPQGSGGPPGDNGPQGAQGDIGPTGAKGFSGAEGPIGPTGPSKSDIRLKQEIEVLKDSLKKILQLDVVEFDWNDKLPGFYKHVVENKKLHSIGLIAQNVKKYFPEVVGLNDGYYFVKYAKLNAVLVEAIKEQQVLIEDIDKELNFIESKLS